WGKAGGRKKDDFRRNRLSSKEQGVMGKTVWLKRHKTEGILELPYKKEWRKKVPVLRVLRRGKGEKFCTKR
ncbi:MAG: hypothetical protein K6E81_03030, partial [Lachnospiraceae bacterium]|nr:hypothetical protein [Lachnospiraceae bacterium]